MKTVETYPTPSIQLSARQLELFTSKEGCEAVAVLMCEKLNECIKNVVDQNPRCNKNAAITVWENFWEWADNQIQLASFGALDSEPGAHIAEAIAKYFNVEMDRWGNVSDQF